MNFLNVLLQVAKWMEEFTTEFATRMTVQFLVFRPRSVQPRFWLAGKTGEFRFTATKQLPIIIWLILQDKEVSFHVLVYLVIKRYGKRMCILKLELKVFFFVQFLITVSSFIIDRIKLIGFAPKDSTILWNEVFHFTA
jgi:hypothetical protein